ncbi:hypothetical protein [Streptomyces gilvosporeus]|uniref:MftR C-terminal domain-containing protein n=1 Tax=Streptomyces gilvosporeus TaxID=553510 RepID=A0A1V0TMJ6_9ACTN|nr:hypothetical protein [Streptomyces gilvosporeus]ARF54154.1 hypothetical protein B1H19_08050 [Streptomyces gilvosporeus]
MRREDHPTTGRREREKAQTRKALADAAPRLFLEHGDDRVGVKDGGRGEALVAAVRDRGPGRSVLEGRHGHLRERVLKVRDPEFRRFRELVDGTPALSEYAHRRWLRHETAPAEALAEETGRDADEVTVRALAHYALAAPRLAGGSEDPAAAVDRIFTLLQQGWGALGG